MSTVAIREFTMADYPAALALWKDSEGGLLGDSDSEESLERFLERNPDLSFVAYAASHLVGAEEPLSKAFVVATTRHIQEAEAANNKKRLKILFERALPEIHGEDLEVTLVEVDYGVGASSMPHRHPGAVHIVGRNAKPDQVARLLAFHVGKQGKPLTIPAVVE